MESKNGMSLGVTLNASEPPSVQNVPPTTTENSIPNAIPINLSGATEKKKRGRPRKYIVASPSGSRTLSPMPLSASAPTVPNTGTQGVGDRLSFFTGVGFMGHSFTVSPGEDVSPKIEAFSQPGPRLICVISAIGVVSTVTLSRPGPSTGTQTFDGRFELLSLSGALTPSGGMRVLFASAHRCVEGGILAGALIAATPIQVVMASFLPANNEEVPGNNEEGRRRRRKTTTSLSSTAPEAGNPRPVTALSSTAAPEAGNPLPVTALSSTAALEAGNPHPISSVCPENGDPASVVLNPQPISSVSPENGEPASAVDNGSETDLNI